MLLPIGDDNRDRRLVPFINYLLVAANVLVFVFLQGLGTNEKFTYAYSAVPAEIISGDDIVTEDRELRDPILGESIVIPGLQPSPTPVYITLLTSIFMHGGIAHIFGNMIFLLIFGDNIENRLGHLRYLFFYLICGILASLAHVFTTTFLGGGMLIPTLGASGAISGILGGYILLYPRRYVRMILFYFVTEVPAVLAIGAWFAFQLINGLGMLGGGSQESGIAYAAHIGGFISGLILIKVFD